MRVMKRVSLVMVNNKILALVICLFFAVLTLCGCNDKSTKNESVCSSETTVSVGNNSYKNYSEGGITQGVDEVVINSGGGIEAELDTVTDSLSQIKETSSQSKKQEEASSNVIYESSQTAVSSDLSHTNASSDQVFVADEAKDQNHQTMDGYTPWK